MECKVALIVQGVDGAPFEFLGPGAVIAIALRPGCASKLDAVAGQDYLLAVEEMSQEEKSQDQKISEAAGRAFAKLYAKLWPEVSIQTLLSADERFRALELAGYRMLYIPFDSRPQEIKFAESLSQKYWQKKLELLSQEFPSIPFYESSLDAHLTALATRGAELVYHVEHAQLKSRWRELKRKKKILMHVCCGPDAAGVINQLKRDFEVTCFWYDPNIQPRAEYDLRLEAFQKVAALENVPVIIGEYDVENFLNSIRGLEHTPEQGAKCSVCYDLRLERSAVEAKKMGSDFYTTTLAISPHKVQEKLKKFGELNFKKHGVPYYTKNYMKDEGFKKSVEYTRDYNIYRQDYCGCWFSLYEGGKSAQALAAQLELSQENIHSGRFQIPEDPAYLATPLLPTTLSANEAHTRDSRRQS